MKKKILVISFLNPFVPRPSGGTYWIRNRIIPLSDFANVTLLTVRNNEQIADEPQKHSIAAYYIDYREQKRSSQSGFLKSLNVFIGNLTVLKNLHEMVFAFRDKVMELTAIQSFDLIQIDDIIIGPLIKYLPANTPKLLVFHNVMTLFYSSIRDSKKRFLPWLLASIECFWIQRFEKSTLCHFKYAVGLTTNECQQIKKLSPSISVYEIPIEVDVVNVIPLKGGEEFPSIAITGTMSYQCNEEAVLYCVTSILPLIKNKFPAIKFYIVGKSPGEKIRQCATEDIIVTGEVKNINEYVKKVNVIVVPIISGGGMRIKILEAFACAKPVVSTSKGAEGIHYTNNVNIVIADTPEVFAAAVCRLLENKEQAAEIGSNGRKLAESEYSAENVWKRWEIVYEQLLGPSA